MVDLTIEDIREALNGYIKDNPESFPIHYSGTREDGTKYSYWKMKGIMMGDGGYELFLKEVLKQGQKINLVDSK
jgi:hypothetical protein